MASKWLVMVVFVFDLIAFDLDVDAELRRSTATIAQDDSGRKYCAYHSDIATGLGVGSFLFLLASQLIIMIDSRCLCCGRGLHTNDTVHHLLVCTILNT
ncbi:hypothetical protein RJ641_002149 [Dillenia turbinata]|uniref:Uncharacterized protein n=1 Tax=Dillenia turbinata TaxID=194707 RepID=A0AAN8VEF7_9MAGN